MSLKNVKRQGKWLFFIALFALTTFVRCSCDSSETATTPTPVTNPVQVVEKTIVSVAITSNGQVVTDPVNVKLTGAVANQVYSLTEAKQSEFNTTNGYVTFAVRGTPGELTLNVTGGLKYLPGKLSINVVEGPNGVNVNLLPAAVLETGSETVPVENKAVAVDNTGKTTVEQKITTKQTGTVKSTASITLPAGTQLKPNTTVKIANVDVEKAVEVLPQETGTQKVVPAAATILQFASTSRLSIPSSSRGIDVTLDVSAENLGASLEVFLTNVLTGADIPAPGLQAVVTSKDGGSVITVSLNDALVALLNSGVPVLIRVGKRVETRDITVELPGFDTNPNAKGSIRITATTAGWAGVYNVVKGNQDSYTLKGVPNTEASFTFIPWQGTKTVGEPVVGAIVANKVSIPVKLETKVKLTVTVTRTVNNINPIPGVAYAVRADGVLGLTGTDGKVDFMVSPGSVSVTVEPKKGDTQSQTKTVNVTAAGGNAEFTFNQTVTVSGGSN